MIYTTFPPLGGQGVLKITASSVLYFGCSKGFLKHHSQEPDDDRK